jgi:Ca2+/Na+ antiporter
LLLSFPLISSYFCAAGWFIDVSALPDDGHGFFQLLTLGCVYGYGLMWAAKLISDGSELLLLVPSVAGIVGSVVLPVLGAVPDGMMVFFSGMGPDAQEQLSVGVGALAGSTVMLLTIPWVLAIIGGRVHYKNGKPNYKDKSRPLPALTDISNWANVGVLLRPEIHRGSHIMMLTSISYLLLQVPGLFYRDQSVRAQAMGEHNWALFGFFLCMIFFFGYLYKSYVQSINKTDNKQMMKREEVMKAAIDNGTLSLLGLLKAEWEFENINYEAAAPTTAKDNQYGAVSTGGKGITTESLANFNDRTARLVRRVFDKYDVEKKGHLNIDDIKHVFSDLGESKLEGAKLTRWFNKMDTNKDNHVDFDEFTKAVIIYVTSPEKRAELIATRSSKYVKIPEPNGSDDEEEDDDDEEEIPDYIREEFEMLKKDPEQQQALVWRNSMQLMAIGTLAVLVLSDPMCDVLNEIGIRLEINPFYVAFVLAPLASNASEFMASYSYALKKTSTTITVSLSALEGAAIMNNTFVLSIFTLLVYVKGLSWEYFAETLAILLAQIFIGIMALKNDHNMYDAAIIIAVFPLSLVIVAGLESMGWD